MRRDSDRDPTACAPTRDSAKRTTRKPEVSCLQLRASSIPPSRRMLRATSHRRTRCSLDESPRGRTRGALSSLSALLVLVPFFVVTFPPITDLPQHLAQVRLFGEALADPGGPIEIQWWTPYSLPYALLGLCRGHRAPLTAGAACVRARRAALGRDGAWAGGQPGTLVAGCGPGVAVRLLQRPVLGISLLRHRLAGLCRSGCSPPRSRDTPPAAGVVARCARSGALRLSCAVAAGGCRVARRHHRRQRGRSSAQTWRAAAARSTADLAGLRLAPAANALALWTPAFQASDVALGPPSGKPIRSRVSIRSGSSTPVLGGLRGPLEWLLLGFVFAWLVLGVVQHRWRLREAIDGRLLLGACASGALRACCSPTGTCTRSSSQQRWMPSRCGLVGARVTGAAAAAGTGPR